ncbi:AcrR family transcriptional regulator [Kutzneria viridogrisea]|uniref:AcrR family transcriptional regulator n=1 Tax=Kutzneria viridogrisea TaxID=47990 RepID=A0ABR6B7M1_9PSEU|nr:helix-turn-helix domain-containing protein [Kutzneria albida]MBA8922873.1 AcrR family transcriptional regulator [Kutzneria viridogrisea]
MVTPEANRPRLSRDLIVAAARSVADSTGLDSLTLREVARELGTGQASLYRHIADRRELLGLLADDLALGFPLADPALPPRERLPALWQSLHGYLSRHRWAARVIVDGEHTSRNAVPFVDSLLDCSAAVGMGPALAMRTYQAVYNLLLGYLLNEHPMGHDREGGQRPLPGWHVAGGQDAFCWAMRCLLDGVLEGRGDL